MTNEHFTSAGACPHDMLLELNNIFITLRKAINLVYNSPCIIFEHGSLPNLGKGGASVDHAHLHILPFTYEILEDISEQFKIQRMESINEIHDPIRHSMPYLFYQNQKNENYIIIDEKIPSQYLRRIIANKTNELYRWNWRENYGLDYIKQTIIDFKCINIDEIHIVK